MSGTNPVGSFGLTNVTSQTSSAWTAQLDANMAVAQRSIDAFAPKPNSPAAMNVLVDAGFLETVQQGGQQVITEVAAQGPLTISTAPSSPNNRIDLIVIDAGTGTASVITGTPATSPTAPACPVGKRKLAQVSVPNGTSSIAASNITDLRAVWGAYGLGIPWCVASGSADIITGAYTPVNAALYDGLIMGFRATAANATTTPTFNADGLGAKTITKKGGQALFAGDIAGSAAEILIRYNLANTRWELLNPAQAPLPSISAALGTDVALNNTASFFDGPSIAQGTSGTWDVKGTVTLTDNASAGFFIAKLWDGTTVIASATVNSPAATAFTTVTLGGVITNPAGNLKISVQDQTTTSGEIKANASGLGKDSTISAVRIG